MNCDTCQEWSDDNCRICKGENTMNIEEAKKMVGTEFIYINNTGAKIKAYVKAFDPGIGLTCYSLEESFDDGWVPGDYIVEKESDGTFCVIGVDIKEHSLEDAMVRLEKIYATGVWTSSPTFLGSFSGCAF